MRVAIATRFGGDPQDFVRRFPDVDFTKVAEAFGCVGIRVTKPGGLV